MLIYACVYCLRNLTKYRDFQFSCPVHNLRMRNFTDGRKGTGRGTVNIEVTVNNTMMNNSASNQSSAGRVLITPLRYAPLPVAVPGDTLPHVLSRLNNITKIMLKAVSKDKKGAFKMFQLRNINPREVVSNSTLVTLIRSQLEDDIIEDHFDVGYISGANVVSIRNKDGLAEVWGNVNKGVNVTLWCDGLKMSGMKSNKRQTVVGDAGGSKRLQVDRQDRVQEIVDTLQKQHKEKFTTTYAISTAE